MSDPAVEFDCDQCGRHIVSLCGPEDIKTCAECRTIPGWFRDPELAARLDPDMAALNAFADTVLAYHPQPKSKSAKQRKRRAQRT